MLAYYAVLHQAFLEQEPACTRMTKQSALKPCAYALESGSSGVLAPREARVPICGIDFETKIVLIWMPCADRVLYVGIRIVPLALTHMYVCTHSHTHIYIHKHTFHKCMCSHTHMYSYMHMYTYVCTCICICIYTWYLGVQGSRFRLKLLKHDVCAMHGYPKTWVPMKRQGQVMGYMKVVDIVNIRGNIGICENLLSDARHTKSYYRRGGLVVSQNKRTQYRQQNTMIVFMGTPQKGPLIFIDPPIILL